MNEDRIVDSTASIQETISKNISPSSEVIDELIKKIAPLILERMEEMVREALACKCCS
jgi:hypothetical protein